MNPQTDNPQTDRQMERERERERERDRTTNPARTDAPTCARPIDIFVIYQHCDCAYTDPATGEKQPCNNTFFSDDAAQMNQLDYTNPWCV